MAPVPVAPGAQVERCDRCQGIACNDHALSALQRQWFLWPKSDPRTFDRGSPSEGRRWDAVNEVACPGCGRTLQAIEVPGQEHILLDRCAACGMTYFDAGEMTDLRFRTLSDAVRRLFKRLS
jgi:Zn-finger nucleic acid-binding protein